MGNRMTEDELRVCAEDINSMSQEDMAYLHRFAPPGHPYFDRTLPLYILFEKRFHILGGMTPEISKAIGW